jgi:hypothetical protein
MSNCGHVSPWTAVQRHRSIRAKNSRPEIGLYRAVRCMGGLASALGCERPEVRFRARWSIKAPGRSAPMAGIDPREIRSDSELYESHPPTRATAVSRRPTDRRSLGRGFLVLHVKPQVRGCWEQRHRCLLVGAPAPRRAAQRGEPVARKLRQGIVAQHAHVTWLRLGSATAKRLK